MADKPSANGSDPSGRSEWERFEALAKKVLGAPKTEVDVLRKKEREKRDRRTRV